MHAAITDLTRTCILCGTFHGRPQELNLHLKTHHSQWVPHVFTKTAQLCKAQASISPCRYCGRKFQRSHMCPVLTQASLLLVNLDLTGGLPGQIHPEVLKCSICLDRFDAHSELLRHLATDHKLEMQDWLPLRDMQGPDPVCSHCLACFGDMAAVRQHITMGQCPSFDPLRPLQLAPVKDEWKPYIQEGIVQQLLQEPSKRMHLTLKCQLCNMSYQRASDLALHLQTVHASMWQLSQRFHPILLKACQAVDGCYCNPKTHVRGLSHTCPALRQLSLMAVHMGQELFIPWRFSPSGLAHCLSTKLPGALLVKLLDCLCTRDFRPLHSDPTLLHAMSTQCLFCGGTFAPAALRDHVHSQHAASGDLVFDLMSQLVPCFSMLAVNDHTCPACKQIFNLPCPDDAAPEVLNDRQQLAQLHLLHQCPAVTQLAYLLADGACRRSDAANPRGRGDVRGRRPDEQCMGNVSEVSRGRKRQQETQKDTTARNTSRRRASSTAASGHGLTDVEDRCGAAVDEKARLLDMLLANRSTSAPSHAGSPSYLLESTKGAAESVGQYSTGASTLAQPFVPDHGQDPPRSADKIGVIGTSGML